MTSDKISPGDLYLVTKRIETKWRPELGLFPDDVLVFVKITKWDKDYLFMYCPRLNVERPYHASTISDCFRKVG